MTRSSSNIFRHREILAPFFLLLAVLSMFQPAASAQQVDNLDVSSSRYIVIDAATGEVIAERNSTERVAIASLTKVFTAIFALESGELDQLITTTEADVYDDSSTRMGFGPGETFTLEELLYGMMLPSGNDAAHAIARGLGATPGASDEEAYANFINLMNDRVKSMGLEDTQFRNPHGWGVAGHYSTARDVATFMMYAMKNPVFREIIGTSTYTTSSGYVVTNTNRLLGGYSGLIGGKTGYDEDAGYCLVEAAERGGTMMVSVTLDGIAPDIWYQDNVTLLDTAFRFKQQRVSAGLPIQGEVLSYVDPVAVDEPASDAELPASDASNAVRVDQQQNPPVFNPAIVQVEGDSGPEENSPVDGQIQTGGGSSSMAGSSTLAVLAVTILIAGVVVIKAVAPRLLRRET